MKRDDFAEWIFGRPMGLTKMSKTELALEPIRLYRFYDVECLLNIDS